MLLFLANAVSYLIYVGVLAVVVREGARPEPIAGGYRQVLRDTAFIRLAVTNVAMIAVGWGVFTWLLPPYARNEIGIGTSLIGLLLLANAATVVIAQVPVARLAEGRRRVVLIALAGVLFTAACLLVAAASRSAGRAYPVLIAASVAVAVGECLHTTALMPLVADLAPAGLRGRYMASMGFSWWIGLAIAPTLGTQLLSAAPAVTFIVAAGRCGRCGSVGPGAGVKAAICREAHASSRRARRARGDEAARQDLAASMPRWGGGYSR
ncbi:MAG: MFS transporter [Streptosporangiaceae bacterium]